MNPAAWAVYAHLWAHDALTWPGFFVAIAAFYATMYSLLRLYDRWCARHPEPPEGPPGNPDCRWCWLQGRTTTGCTCTGYPLCTYDKCIGDYTSLIGWSATDQRRLQELLGEDR